MVGLAQGVEELDGEGRPGPTVDDGIFFLLHSSVLVAGGSDATPKFQKKISATCFSKKYYQTDLENCLEFRETAFKTIN